jgi:HK97 family phage prohead protease
MDRAYSLLDIRAYDDDERVIEGIASTPSPDRYGDIVNPMGAKFATPMPLLWQHDAQKPVGTVEFAKPTKAGIPFRARLAKIEEPGTLKDRVDEAWQSLKAKLVRAVSIGFRSLKHSYLENGGIEFSEWEWLELSLVTIPANADATITSIKSIDRELRAAAKKKKFAVGDEVEALASHMDGMKGMTGKIAIVEDGPYYAVEFDKPHEGMKQPHKWLSHKELKLKKPKDDEHEMSASTEASAVVGNKRPSGVQIIPARAGTPAAHPGAVQLIPRNEP